VGAALGRLVIQVSECGAGESVEIKKPAIKAGFFLYVHLPSKQQRECEIRVERVKGIEPSLSAWEAGVMPLYDTRSERLTLYQMCAWK
jgi:hypothetical protein